MNERLYKILKELGIDPTLVIPPSPVTEMVDSTSLNERIISLVHPNNTKKAEQMLTNLKKAGDIQRIMTLLLAKAKRLEKGRSRLRKKKVWVRDPTKRGGGYYAYRWVGEEEKPTLEEELAEYRVSDESRAVARALVEWAGNKIVHPKMKQEHRMQVSANIKAVSLAISVHLGDLSEHIYDDFLDRVGGRSLKAMEEAKREAERVVDAIKSRVKRVVEKLEAEGKRIDMMEVETRISAKAFADWWAGECLRWRDKYRLPVPSDERIQVLKLSVEGALLHTRVERGEVNEEVFYRWKERLEPDVEGIVNEEIARYRSILEDKRKELGLKEKGK